MEVLELPIPEDSLVAFAISPSESFVSLEGIDDDLLGFFFLLLTNIV